MANMSLDLVVIPTITRTRICTRTEHLRELGKRLRSSLGRSDREGYPMRRLMPIRRWAERAVCHTLQEQRTPARPGAGVPWAIRAYQEAQPQGRPPEVDLGGYGSERSGKSGELGEM